MEKPYNNEDRILSRIVSEGGLEKPSAHFSNSVMAAIREESKPAGVTYSPLLPKWSWILLGAAFVACIVWAVLYPGEGGQWLTLAKGIDLGSYIPDLKISSNFMYCVLFLGLFLIQVPLLKRQLQPR